MPDQLAMQELSNVRHDAEHRLDDARREQSRLARVTRDAHVLVRDSQESEGTSRRPPSPKPPSTDQASMSDIRLVPVSREQRDDLARYPTTDPLGADAIVPAFDAALPAAELRDALRDAIAEAISWYSVNRNRPGDAGVRGVDSVLRVLGIETP